MKLSANFDLEEFTYSFTAQKRGIINSPTISQISNLQFLCTSILQPIRDKWKDTIKVTSGFRSHDLNKVIGGSKTSQHLKGEAADIVCRDNNALWKMIVEMIEKEEIVVGQLIDEYDLKWIHISIPTSNKCNRILKIS